MNYLPIHTCARLLVLAAVLLTTLHAADAADGNLIQNSSFEIRSGPRQDYFTEPWGYGELWIDDVTLTGV